MSMLIWGTVKVSLTELMKWCAVALSNGHFPPPHLLCMLFDPRNHLCHYHNLYQLVKIIEVLESAEMALYNSCKFQENTTQSLWAAHSSMENSEKSCMFWKGWSWPLVWGEEKASCSEIWGPERWVKRSRTSLRHKAWGRIIEDKLQDDN